MNLSIFMRDAKTPISYKAIFILLSLNLVYFCGYTILYLGSSGVEIHWLTTMQSSILTTMGFNRENYSHLNFAAFLLIFAIPIILTAFSLFVVLRKMQKIVFTNSLMLLIFFGGGIFCLSVCIIVMILLFLPSTSKYYESLNAGNSQN
jgi:hypothetical protein